MTERIRRRLRQSLTRKVGFWMDEFIDCFNNLNIEHGFVTLFRKINHYFLTKIQLVVTRNSTGAVLTQVVVLLVKQVGNINEKSKKSFSDVLLKDEEVTCGSSYDPDRQVILRAKKNVHPNYPPHPKELRDIDIPDFF
ncbi:hypothetical protein BpHYR1_015858 [Brachionus plicatilis]|uniref:Uncharacterized protein n=1 Tax=Brachionus plicatilis TaxID=10195 RepID=A0A3M7PMP0_BRAPC|nr:hypothetical protein BpHYR1_015858 [Brachionus plicatilis]